MQLLVVSSGNHLTLFIGLKNFMPSPLCLCTSLSSDNWRLDGGFSGVSKWWWRHWSLWAELRWVRLVISFFILLLFGCVSVSLCVVIHHQRYRSLHTNRYSQTVQIGVVSKICLWEGPKVRFFSGHCWLFCIYCNLISNYRLQKCGLGITYFILSIVFMVFLNEISSTWKKSQNVSYTICIWIV